MGLRVRLLQLSLVTVGVGTGLFLVAGTAMADSSATAKVQSDHSAVVSVTQDSSSSTSDISQSSLVTGGKNTDAGPGSTVASGGSDRPSNAGTGSNTGLKSSDSPSGGVVSASSSQSATGVTASGGTSTAGPVGNDNLMAAAAASATSTPTDSSGSMQSRSVMEQAQAAAAAVRQASGAVTYSQGTGVAVSPPSVGSSAPTAPSSASNSHQPSPVQSSGVLTGISQLLATVTVPSWRQLHLQPLPLAALAVGTLVSLLLWPILTNLLMTDFADTTRRSGYAHAPRSDLAANFFSFATPQAVSLHVALSPPGGSLFGGV